jgi:hypothetical protein
VLYRGVLHGCNNADHRLRRQAPTQSTTSVSCHQRTLVRACLPPSHRQGNMSPSRGSMAIYLVTNRATFCFNATPLTGMYWHCNEKVRYVIKSNNECSLCRSDVPNAWGLCRVFLIRDSQSVAGAYVLSFVHNAKVKHCPILRVSLASLLLLIISCSFLIGRISLVFAKNHRAYWRRVCR